jgi:hypothetical protein
METLAKPRGKRELVPMAEILCGCRLYVGAALDVSRVCFLLLLFPPRRQSARIVTFNGALEDNSSASAAVIICREPCSECTWQRKVEMADGRLGRFFGMRNVPAVRLGNGLVPSLHQRPTALNVSLCRRVERRQTAPTLRVRPPEEDQKIQDRAQIFPSLIQACASFLLQHT